MSLIIFKDKVLYADRSGVETQPLKRFVSIKKLYTHPDLTFALATVGSVLRHESEEFKEFIKYLHDHLKVLDRLTEGLIYFPLSKFRIENSWFVITKKHFYVSVPVYKLGDYQGFNLVRQEITEEYYTGGSGCHIATTFLELKKPIKEVFHKTSILESDMFPTEIDSVKMNSLKPFQYPRQKLFIDQ